MKFRHLVFFLSLLPLHAEEPPNRFKKTQELPKDSKDLPQVGMSSLLYFEAPQRLILENPSPAYSTALQWLKEGKAQVVESTYLCSQPGQNCYTHSGSELIYPTESPPPYFQDEWSVPQTFDTKNLGYYSQTNLARVERNEVSARVSAQFVKHFGNKYYEPLVKATHLPGDISMPRFAVFRFNSGLSTPANQHQLISSFQKHGDEGLTILIYHCCATSTLTPSEKSFDQKKEIELSLTIAPVSTKDWLGFSTPCSLDELRLRTAAWFKHFPDKAIYHESFSIPLEQKNEFRKGKELIYPTSFKRPSKEVKLSGDSKLIPDQLDTKKLGLTFVGTPKKTKTGHLSLSYRIDLIKHCGEHVVHRVKIEDSWIADATVPHFNVNSVNSSTFLTAGAHTLLGVTAATDKQGNPDPNTRLLFFLKAN